MGDTGYASPLPPRKRFDRNFMQAQNHSLRQRGQVIPVFLSLHHPTTSQQEARVNPAPHIHLRRPLPSQHQSPTPTVPTVRPALTPSPPLLHPTLPPPPSHRLRIPSHQASLPTPPTLLPPHQLH